MPRTRTDDLALAAYLVAHGHSLLGLEPPPGRATSGFFFIFSGVPEDAAREFYAGGLVSGVAFHNALRFLRRKISEAQREVFARLADDPGYGRQERR